MRPQNFPLRVKITFIIAIMFGLVAILLSVLIPGRVREMAMQAAERQASSLSAVLANGARVPYDLADLQGPDDLLKVLAMLEDAQGAEYAEVRNQDDKVLASWNPTKKTYSKVFLKGKNKHKLVRDPLMLHVVSAIETTSGSRGVLQMGFSLEKVNQEGKSNQVFIILVMVLAMVLGTLILTFLVERIIVGPIRRLSNATTQIVASGDLTYNIETHSHDEVGALAESFGLMVDSQRSILRTLRNLSQALGEAIQHITQSGTAVTEGAGTIQTRVEATSEAMQNMLRIISESQHSVEILQQSAEDGATTIHEMAVINNRAAENSQSMAALVTQNTEAINGMAYSSKDIARSIEKVNAAVRDTSTSMTQLEASVLRVENSAIQSAAISSQVASDADTGALLLDKTLKGITAIQATFGTASETIDQLISRVMDVSNILHVIEEITEQTNLLALNAAIISAQAGEHGRGFSVVAEEIRALADRTKTSTQEITQLIANIQRDSEQAISAMGEGMNAVDEGVDLGREAAQFIKGIQSSTREATMKVEEISQATVEQARGNSSIAKAINRIAETMNQINRATSDQARASEQVNKGTEQMNQVNQVVLNSSIEQAEGSSKIIEFIDRISSIVDTVGTGQNEQSQGAETVLDAVQAIEDVSITQNNSAQHLEQVIVTLRDYARELEKSLEKFRTD